MKKNFQFPALIFGVILGNVALFYPAKSFAALDTVKMQELKSSYMKSCLGSGGVKEICLCSFDRAVTTMKLEELEVTIKSVGASIPADTKSMRVLNKAATYCAKQIGKMPAEERLKLEGAPAVTPIQPDSILVPPPPPPLMNGTSIKPEPIAVPQPDSSSKDDLSSSYLADKVDAGEKPIIARKIEIKKKATAEPKKQAYFGQYDAQFFAATINSDLTALRALSGELPNLDIKDKDGNTPLIISAIYGKEISMKFLLERAASPNAKNNKSQTALHIAAFSGRSDMVETLLSYAADVNITYGTGFTPLMLAVMKQTEASVYSILKYKAKPDAAQMDGTTALHIAAGGQNMNIIGWLVTYKANVNIKNKQGYTPLMIAAYNGNMEAVQTLLGYQANPYITDKSGRTAGQLAYMAGHFQIAGLLGYK